MSSEQISEHFEDQFIDLHTIRLPLTSLCSGVLVTGATGCGKTTGVVNSLARELISLNQESRHTKAALVYINAKGTGATAFEATLPQQRKKDLLRVSLDESVPFTLFDRRCWDSPEELSEAVCDFILEVNRHHSGNADTEGNHKLYFDNLRDRPMRLLSRLGHGTAAPSPAAATSEENPLNQRSHLLSVIHRLKGFCGEFTSSSSSVFQTATESFQIKQAYEHALAKANVDEAMLTLHLSEVPKEGVTAPNAGYATRLFMRSLRKLAGIGATPSPEQPIDHYTRWKQSLSSDEQRSLSKLVKAFRALPDNNLQSTIASLESLCDAFLGKSFSAICPMITGNASAHSFESIIDEGKILIIDLPIADSAGASRFVLSALSLALMSTTLRRYRIRFGGHPINQRRPLVVVADEFHSYLCSQGRHQGLEAWLSLSREFGVIPILATQNINLPAMALQSQTRLYAVLGNLCTRFHGHNRCPETNLWAAFSAGTKPVQDAAVINWFNDPDLEEALSTLPKSQQNILEPNALTSLGVGAFIVQTATGSVYRLNANRQLPQPRIEELHSPSMAA